MSKNIWYYSIYDDYKRVITDDVLILPEVLRILFITCINTYWEYICTKLEDIFLSLDTDLVRKYELLLLICKNVFPGTNLELSTNNK